MLAKLSSLSTIIDKHKESFILVDKNVFDLYRGDLQFKRLVVVTPGEECKSFDEYVRCVNILLEMGVKRDSHILAIGGGALSDLAGYVAGTILRGILWSIVPTTLLSMVDASIGGKTGINTPHGKNLVGAFHFPRKIYLYTPFLDTLSSEELLSGKGEILKYCFLSKNVYRAVRSGKSMQKVIELCQRYKMKIVRKDSLENGIRKYLNFGHTIGHVVEVEKGYSHGLSVVCGIDYILNKKGDDVLRASFTELTNRLGIILPADYKSLSLESLYYDKKGHSVDSVNLVVVTKIGRPMIESVPLESLRG